MFVPGYPCPKHFHYYLQLSKNLNYRIKLTNLTLASRMRVLISFLFKLITGNFDWRFCYVEQIRRVILWDIKRKENKYTCKYSPIRRKLLLWRGYPRAIIFWGLYYTYLQSHPSALVGLWNGRKRSLQLLSLAATALNRKIVYFENGLLPNTTTMDDAGINYHNSLPRNAEFYLDYWSSVKSRKFGKNLPKRLTPIVTSVVSEAEPQNLPPYYIFVPFQIDTDSQLLDNSTWICNMQELFFLLKDIHIALTDKRLCFVIKEHPRSKKKYYNLNKFTVPHRYLIFASGYSTQKLIQHAHGVLTINSTVGMEAILLGQKVITLGKACYNIPGLVKTAHDKKSLRQHINALPAWKPNADLRLAFLSYVYYCYSIPKTRDNPNNKHWQAINDRLNKIRTSRAWLPDFRTGQVNNRQLSGHS